MLLFGKILLYQGFGKLKNKRATQLRVALSITDPITGLACSLVSYFLPEFAASTRDFNFCPGRKVTTRRAEMGISSPVFGFLPGL
jgi:hypothetical protein